MAPTTKETGMRQPKLGEIEHQRPCAARADAGGTALGQTRRETPTRADSGIEHQPE